MEQKPNTTILVADDEESILTMLRDALQSLQYNVVLARNGEEAMEIVRQSPPDLLILDIMMPKMDGYEVCRLVKSDLFLRHIPVMLLTAKAGTNSKVAGL